MCQKPKPGEKVVPIHCQPLKHPCPSCGRMGRRKARHERFVRSLALGQILWLHVFYAEYRARCGCRKTFRSCPPGITPKADYDNLIRQAVLDRILDDGLNVQRTIAAMKRDFLLDLSVGFIYDCLDWGLRQLDPAMQRRFAREQFSGTLNIDELHLGKFTLLLATDPIANRIVGYSLVAINDQAHMRCFLRTLQYWGFKPTMVVTDGSNLYPALLSELWPQSKHQLCVFHVLQDITNSVLAGVRRLRRQQAKRGNSGRKRARGGQGGRRRTRRGPTLKEKAKFVYKHRFLVVKRAENLTEVERKTLATMFGYLPELRKLWEFGQEIYKLFSTEQVIRLARRRRTLLLKKQQYQEVPELAKAMGLLEGAKFDKMVAFLETTTGPMVRTNNHVERANRMIRFDEKVRYKWRTRRSIDRFVCLRLARLANLSASNSPRPDSKRSSPPSSRASTCRD